MSIPYRKIWQYQEADVSLWTNGPFDDMKNFAVRYGLEVHENLNYDDAAKELGRALLHAIVCRQVAYGLLGSGGA